MAASLDEVREDHLIRYRFACDIISRAGGARRILDAGAGIGYGSSLLSEVAEEVVAYERAEEAFACYREHFARLNIDFRNTDIFDFSGDEAFDAVVCFEFIEHIPNPEDLLPRFASSSPLLICSTPNELVRPHKREPVNPYHFRHYTPDEFDGLLHDAGFETVARYNQSSGEKPRIHLGYMGKFMIAVARRYD